MAQNDSDQEMNELRLTHDFEKDRRRKIATRPTGKCGPSSGGNPCGAGRNGYPFRFAGSGTSDTAGSGRDGRRTPGLHFSGAIGQAASVKARNAMVVLTSTWPI